MWLPDLGLNLGPPHWERKVLTIGTRGKSLNVIFFFFFLMRDPKSTLSFQRSWFRLSHFLEFLTTHRPLNLKRCFMITQCQFSSVQPLSRVRLFATPWIAACQASLSITNSQSSPKLMSINTVMPSSHLILCHPLLLLPSIPPSIRVFSNESTLRMRWPKYWSFSFSISPSNEHPELISFRMDWLDLAVQGTLKSLLQHHSSKVSVLQRSDHTV